ncbi:MAG: hypothetical protein ACK5FV_13020, partial [Bacteroidota bacterium]
SKLALYLKILKYDDRLSRVVMQHNSQQNRLIMVIIGIILGLFAVGEGLITLTEMLQRRVR